MIDWTPFLTENIVDELASHVKLYRRANQKLRKDHVTKGSVSTAGDSFLLDSSDEGKYMIGSSHHRQGRGGGDMNHVTVCSLSTSVVSLY